MESVGGGRARFMRPLTFSSPCRSMTARISSYTQIIHQIIKRERARERDGERGNGGGEKGRTVLHKKRFLKNYREDI